MTGVTDWLMDRLNRWPGPDLYLFSKCTPGNEAVPFTLLFNILRLTNHVKILLWPLSNDVMNCTRIQFLFLYSYKTYLCTPRVSVYKLILRFSHVSLKHQHIWTDFVFSTAYKVFFSFSKFILRWNYLSKVSLPVFLPSMTEIKKWLNS